VTLSVRTIVLLTLPPLFWAGNAVVGRAVVGEFPPLALSLLRWCLALALLLPFAWRAIVNQRRTIRTHGPVLLASGALGVGVYNSFQYLALQTSPALNVTLIASSAPVFVLLFGAVLFQQRTGRAQWAGALLSILGVLVVLLRGDAARLTELRIVAGDLWMIGAAASWALYTWLLRTRRPALDLAPFLLLQMAIGSVLIAPFAAAEAYAGAQIVWSGKTVGALLFVALLPSLAAYWCWDRGVAQAGAVVPVYFANLTPVFAAVLGAALLGEAPQLYHLFGLLLIIAGIHLAAQRQLS
jgi:drug/metabolite transporter (DMT)-like permease